LAAILIAWSISIGVVQVFRFYGFVNRSISE
jgi:hypothetical protein